MEFRCFGEIEARAYLDDSALICINYEVFEGSICHHSWALISFFLLVSLHMYFASLNVIIVGVS